MPKLGESAKKAKCVLLGNISPEIQESVLGDMENPEFVILDTMDLWIQTANAKLRELIRRTDLLILNDSEAKMLSENRNIICAGDALLEMGAKSVIIKTGEYGAMLFHPDGFFVIPAYPVRDLRDPTGAGDSFAGALAGYIAGAGKTDFETIKLGMLAGAATSSLTVESFSCYKLEESGLGEINRRCQYIEKITSIRR